MKTLLNFRNIFVAIVLSLLVCHNSTAANTSTTDTPNNCTTCTKKQQPYSFKHKMKTKVPVQEVNLEKAYQDFLKTKNPYWDFSFYLGVSDSFKTNMDTNGLWETLPNGDRVWRMQLHTDHAWVTGIGIKTTDLVLPEGCSLFFYSPDKKFVVGSVSDPKATGLRERLVNSIPGKTLCMEYYEPKTQKGKGVFNINSLILRLNDFPYGTTHRLKKTVPFVMPYSKEEYEIITKNLSNARKGEARSAEQPTKYSLNNSGVWETLPNGDRIWRLGIRCELGNTIKLWTKIVIPKGGYFAHYSTNGYHISSCYTTPTNEYNNDFFTIPTIGRELIVEYYEPKNAKDKGKIDILSVDIDVTKWYVSSVEREMDEQTEGEPDCIPNVVCDCDDFNNTQAPPFCNSSLTDLPNTLKKSVVRIRLFYPCAVSFSPPIAFLQKKAIFFCPYSNKNSKKPLT